MSNVVFTEGYNYPVIRLPGAATSPNANIGTLEDFRKIANLADKSGMFCVIAGNSKLFFIVYSITSSINAYRISYSADSTTIIFAGFNTNNGVLNYSATSRAIPLNT